jgi:hypothetical protein
MSRTRRQLLTAAPLDARALSDVLAAQELSLACYGQVIGAPAIAGAGPATARLLGLLRGQERDHVSATRAALRERGGHPPAPPTGVAAIDRALATHRIGGRPGQLRGPRDALGLLLAVERIAIGAAYTALATVREPTVSLLLAQMMASDAQHAALVQERAHPGAIAQAIAYGVVQGLS